MLQGLAVTVFDTVLLRSDHRALLRAGPLLAELAVGAGLVLCDGWAYGGGHAFSTSQPLGSVWPLSGILACGVAFGPLPAAMAGVALGLARTAEAGGRAGRGSQPPATARRCACGLREGRPGRRPLHLARWRAGGLGRRDQGRPD